MLQFRTFIKLFRHSVWVFPGKCTHLYFSLDYLEVTALLYSRAFIQMSPYCALTGDLAALAIVTIVAQEPAPRNLFEWPIQWTSSQTQCYTLENSFCSWFLNVSRGDQVGHIRSEHYGQDICYKYQITVNLHLSFCRHPRIIWIFL